MVGMQAETMPRFGSAVDQTETIPRDQVASMVALVISWMKRTREITHVLDTISQSVRSAGWRMDRN